MKRGMLIKVGNDLLRVMDVQHMTPGNKRGFVQARLRNIRTRSLTDLKLRAEEDVEIRLEALELSPEAFGSSLEQESTRSLGQFEETLRMSDVFGAFRAFLDGIFDDKVFVISFTSNVLIAAVIVFLGDKLGVGAQLSTGVVVVLGIRIFSASVQAMPNGCVRFWLQAGRVGVMVSPGVCQWMSYSAPAMKAADSSLMARDAPG